MSIRPPRTSYGYLAPPEARVKGWECNHPGCGTGEPEVPRSWPYPCRNCGRPADAMFEEPWAHAAKGHQIRHDLNSPDRFHREQAQWEQHLWEYKDACLRGDHKAKGDAWQRYREFRALGGLEVGGWSMTMHRMVLIACEFDDIDRVACDLLERYPLIDTHDLEEDNGRRTVARSFVSMCIAVLERESSIDHAREAELYSAMRDIARRCEDVLTVSHHDGFRRISELRAFHRSRAAIAQGRQSLTAAFDGLPTISPAALHEDEPLPLAADELRGIVGTLGRDPSRGLALVAAVVEVAETNDDTHQLDELVRHLDAAGHWPGLTHLLRARLHVVTGDLPAARAALELAAGATDRFAGQLRPQILATRGMLRVRMAPKELDNGMADCRAGRKAGLGWWRRTTAADVSLAWLLLSRGKLSEAPPARRLADLREAVHLARRHGDRADDRLVLQEALAARDALTGHGGHEHRHRAWRRSVAARSGLAARARLAAGWAEWAVGAGVAQYAAEAYEQLVALAAQDAAARYGPRAKQRVLAAAQEYAEEAGYWLARTGRYREAALALENGRAVGLTEILGRDNAAVLERLRAAGREDLAGEYERAVDDVAEQERHPSAGLGHARNRLRDVARRVAVATGTDPLAVGVSYDDIIAATGDGSIVYVAAAKAGGYALVVAARHDPQYVSLPKLDRAGVAEIVGLVQAAAEESTGYARFATADGRLGRVRDLAPAEDAVADPMAAALRRLWNDGVKDLVFPSGTGHVVTLVPVGLLNLLPIHAAGESSDPGDRYTEWRHAGRFSTIRYAPNARSLRRCRDAARELTDREHTLLAVDVPDGHGVGAAGHLHYVTRETIEVTRRWTGRAAQPFHACTWEEFHTAADRHTAWHLACHGSADPQYILDSRLYFADRSVTLDELGRTLTPGRRRLAVLSACRTNLTGSAMPNEGIGLPSVLLQVGFAGVIATAWAVDDLATTYLMTVFYQRWCQAGDDPAVALNRAQHWLRRATRADLTALLPDLTPAGGPGRYPYADLRYWAPFAYTGA